jgi:hypothetical protein
MTTFMAPFNSTGAIHASREPEACLSPATTSRLDPLRT